MTPASQVNPIRARRREHKKEQLVHDFLHFLLAARTELSQRLVANSDPQVQHMQAPLEEHYVDEQGKPAMYQRFESAMYDDARQVVTLWKYFDTCDRDQLVAFQQLLCIEQQGLTGDRHPRRVFDRSPFGICALVVGTVTIWMTVLRTFTGEDLSELLELIRFNWVAGTIWIVGLFVALWYILKMLRNNRQVAFLSSVDRAMQLYLLHDDGTSSSRAA